MRLKYDYSVISVIVHSLPDNTQNLLFTLFGWECELTNHFFIVPSVCGFCTRMDFVPGTGAANESKQDMGRARRLHRTRHTGGWQQPLRFEIGACVRCMCDEQWSKGRVVALNYEEPKVCYHPTISSLLDSLHSLLLRI